MFLCGVLIGNESAEDLLLKDFYTGLRRERAQGWEQDCSTDRLNKRLLPVIHAHLRASGRLNIRPPDEARIQSLVFDEAMLKKTDSLIGGYYRERRAAFVADRDRIRRLYREISGDKEER